MKASNASSAAALVSAIQISCNARLAFGCWLFGNLASTLAVLCTQQRCSRVFGQTSPAAFQNPSAPSAMVSRRGTLRPRPAAALPDPGRALGDGAARRHGAPPPLQIEQQIAPVLRALAGAIGEA